ncbi:hypothetical protein [Mycobacterium mantenii]|uniref:hypothetical protein n=1 Tax=Mycobacterium mantenii TaxID=560555 RepID=UPI000AF2F8F5|nr:hypothetical protein [Mycobacterium mantenii]
MTTPEPFDRSLPSPIGRLRDLLASAGEAVVGETLSSVQQRMYQAGDLERHLLDLVRDDGRPDLVVIAGSAGGGKSAIIRHVLDDSGTNFGDCIADATHAEAPNKEQVDRLADFFSPFVGTDRPGGPTRLIAMNTGMVLKFFRDLSRRGRANQYAALEHYMKERLNVPMSVSVDYPSWLNDAVLIINLDHRPTAGQAGDIFDLMLERLDPDRVDGVLEGAPRCETCKVIGWCYPRANAQIMSSEPGRTALNGAVGDIALRRGRNLAPRALWDLAGQLALGGINTNENDPCDVIAEIAEANDITAVIQGLATGTALDDGTGLCADLVGADPSLAPSSQVHDLVAAAGLDPHADASVVRGALAGESGTRPAVETAAAAIREGRAAIGGRQLARAAWLGGLVPSRAQIPDSFAAALIAQQGLSDGAETPRELLEAIEYVAEGLASGFGVVSGPESFFPTDDGAGVTRKTDVFVRADLVQEGMLWPPPDGDPIVAANPRGAKVVGYRPLTIAMQLTVQAQRRGSGTAVIQPLDVSLPLWDLLGRAAAGTVPSSVDKERFLGLRRAMESVGRLAGQDRMLPLLVRRRGSNRKFRIAPFGPGGRILRANEVL